MTSSRVNDTEPDKIEIAVSAKSKTRKKREKNPKRESPRFLPDVLTILLLWKLVIDVLKMLAS